MKQIIGFLNENRNGFLATDEGGQPRVRPFGFMFEEGGKFYFCTNSTKNVCRQLAANPLVEYAVMSPQMVTLRITGEAVFTEDMDKKEKAIAASEVVKNVYKSADNPVFKVFCIAHGKAVLAEFGKVPKVVEF